MTASIAGPIAYIDVSEMAVKDDNRHWIEIHRALSWRRLDAETTEYHVACGLEFESKVVRPSPLSSGWVIGARCARCWGHMATESQWARVAA